MSFFLMGARARMRTRLIFKRGGEGGLRFDRVGLSNVLNFQGLISQVWDMCPNLETKVKKMKRQNNRDLKIRGREGQDGNGSGRGKLSRVPSCRQKQNA